MRTLVRLGAACGFVVCLFASLALSGLVSADIRIIPAANAQAIPKSLEAGGSENAVRDRKNNWTVGVAGGLLSGTYMTFADELAQVLDDGDNLRVMPIVTYGAASNLDDLLYLRGVDVAITQSDVFEYFRTQRKVPNLESRVNYLIRLPVSEMHVLARDEIKSIADLKGKKVNFGPAGSASSLTGSIVFQRLGVEVEQVLYDNPTALQKLKTGELAALVRVIPKPVEFFGKIQPGSGLHFVSIPFTRAFADYYTVGEFSHKEYPGLVGDGERVDTLAVPAVLAVFNWPKYTDRYRRVERFTQQLFAKWDKFQQPPRHPKWRDVNLAATVPGWTRWAPADDILKHMNAQATTQGASPPSNAEFDAFLKTTGSAAGNLSPEQREALFRQFMQWRQNQAPAH
jgi:TRAP-type uncharacterized transport system substrate-binding protein